MSTSTEPVAAPAALPVAVPPAADHRLPGFEPGDPRGAVRGRLLGSASSRRPSHNHAGPVLPEGARCSACRWFEVRIVRVADDPAAWLVYTAGFSDLPGEVTIPKVVRTTSPWEVVELMTIRNSKDGTIIPRPNARALAQAAGHDELIQDAYVNRATA